MSTTQSPLVPCRCLARRAVTRFVDINVMSFGLMRAFNCDGTNLESYLGSISTIQPWSPRIRFWVSTYIVMDSYSSVNHGTLAHCSRYEVRLPIVSTHPTRPTTDYLSYRVKVNPESLTHPLNSFLSHTVQHKLELLSTAMDCLYAKVIPMITDCAYILAPTTFIPANSSKG